MDELGLFPLGIVLLPTERIPLHIFEPRYKELIDECLADEREFGMLLVDEDGLRRVGTRARIVTVLGRFDDGRGGWGRGHGCSGRAQRHSATGHA